MHPNLEREILLSIVIPVFNTSQYLEKCVRSLGISDHKNQVEVIIVDDGSTDGSANVISSIKEWFDDLIVISQENSGLGAARNAGLMAAKGSYVWFVDSDDYAPVDAIKNIVGELCAHQPDVLTICHQCADESGKQIDWVEFRFVGDHEVSLSGDQFFDLNYRWTYAPFFISRREIFLKYDLRFEPRINMQDAELMPRLLFHAKSVRISDIHAYNYVKRDSSYINSSEPVTRNKYFDSVLEVYDRLSAFQKLIKNEHPIMTRGVDKKLNAIEEILFLSYLYEPQDTQGAKARLIKLRCSGIFPFKFHSDCLMRLKLYRKLLMTGTNISPIAFKKFFTVIRRVLN